LAQPRVLLVAPLSGHFATLLRATVNTVLADHDVYITDWHNARDVALSERGFGFDDFIQHLIDFLETIGPGAHVVAVCQPCVAALVATAVMAQSQHAAQPRSITLMAGPIDTRVHPTKVNELCDFEADFMVRAEPDRDRADAISRRIPAGLPWVCAARCLHEHEHRAAHQGPQGALREPPRRRDREGQDHQGFFTTNILPCWTLRRSSISKP